MGKKKSLDSLTLGIIVGSLLPTAVFLVVYFVKYSSGAYAYLGIKNILGSVIPKVMSLCAVANLVPFYYFLQTNRMQAVKGVLIGTVVVAIFVFLVFLVF